jgi:glycosyltransferase involved in cell wall biosynthesis
MKKITIVIPCFNEEGNLEYLYEKIAEVMLSQKKYDHEYIFIDNASTDNSQEILRKLANLDNRVKVILNTRNFGQIRSPYHAILQSEGDATILMACDFQDPPEMIPKFIEAWEKGVKMVIAVKTKSKEFPLMYALRTAYYRCVSRFSEVELNENSTGFGLYDRSVIEVLRKIDDPYPYFRGLISEIGMSTEMIPFTQPRRSRGITKNNFYTLYDIGILGFIKHSKVPLRLATMGGFAMAILSLITGMGYLIYKVLFWERFSTGIAPVVIGLFLFCSVQLFFIGILGEYIGAILTQVRKLPLVVEKERINF